MKLKDIIEVTKAHVIDESMDIDYERVLKYGMSCDLMSDVLMLLRKTNQAMDIDGTSVLITGLSTMQAIRTAEMLDIDVIMFVRGKKPNQNVIDQAKRSDILLLSTKLMMYSCCGELYASGMLGLTS